MSVWLLPGLLVALASPVTAQDQRPSRVVFEGAIGVARFVESFSSDCCGPARDATGSSVSLRLKGRRGRLTELGVEGGATFAGQRDMKWLMAIGSVATATRISTWAQVGAGFIAQPGECPADAPDTSPECKVQPWFGGLVTAGVRWPLVDRLAVGLEAALVRGANHNERSFTTQRIGVTLRLLR